MTMTLVVKATSINTTVEN